MTSIAAATSTAVPSHWGRRLAVLLAGLVVLGAVGAGAAVHHRQQDQLASAQSDRDAAVHALAAALTAATAEGVPGADLAAVQSQRAAILGEPAVAPRLRWLDAGQIGHLRDQAGRLRSVLSTIPAIEAAVVQADRQTASTGLDALEQSLGDARELGLAMAALRATIAVDREAIAAATTPLVVSAVVGELPVLAADVQRSITDRKAALAAAARAALDGARADAQSALARADSLLSQAGALPQLQLGDAPQTIATAHGRLSVAQTRGDFEAVSALLVPPVSDLGGLLRARSDAYSSMAGARGVVSAAQQQKIDTSAAGQQLDALQPQLDGAATAPAFAALTNRIDGTVSPLLAQLARVTVGMGKVIVISLAKQSLTAYQDGVQYLTTLITTGRPGLETPTGTYSVLRKSTPWLFRSMYPPGSPGYYTPAWSTWVLWFRNDGYGIHDAPWRASYGPGTQAHGSHGCVNVPHSSMAQLFPWADVGTKVIVV